MLEGNSDFTPAHKIKFIRYCWNSLSSDQELLGVQITVHDPNVVGSEIRLNRYGTISSEFSCSRVSFKEDEYIQYLQVIYSEWQVTGVAFRTNLGENILMGAASN